MFKPPAEYVMMAMKGSFTKNKSLLRHVRTGHQGMKRTDNETRKKDQESTDKARKQGLLACGSWPHVRSQLNLTPQAVFKPPADTSHVRISVRVRYQQVSIQRPVRSQLNLTPQVRSRAPLGARSGDPDLPGFPLKRRSRSKS